MNSLLGFLIFSLTLHVSFWSQRTFEIISFDLPLPDIKAPDNTVKENLKVRETPHCRLPFAFWIPQSGQKGRFCAVHSWSYAASYVNT